jgi:hypothetical protein
VSEIIKRNKKRSEVMSIKQILCLLIAVAIVSPVMAKGKKVKPIRGRLVSITKEKIVVKIKGDEKTFTLNEETKIVNKNGEEVAVGDVKFKAVALTTDPEDETKITQVKEASKKSKNKKTKKDKKDKKDKSSDEAEE